MKRNRGSPAQRRRAKKPRVEAPVQGKDTTTQRRASKDLSGPDIVSWPEATVASRSLQLNEDLKKAGFPKAVQETLQTLKVYFSQHQELKLNSFRNRDVVSKLVSTFIFSSQKTARPDRTAVITLHILQMICSSLNNEDDSNVRVQMFNTLFPPDINSSMQQLQARLVSLAISCRLANVLDTVAHGIMEEHLSFMGRVVTTDFCVLLPSVLPDLQNVLKLSPSLAAVLLRAFTQIFNLPSNQLVELPPLSLLSVVTGWVHSQPMLPYSFPSTVSKPSIALLYPHPNCSSTPSLAVSGLVSWTILSPLLSDARDLESTSIQKDTESECSALCSRLHVSVLRGAVEFQKRTDKLESTKLQKYAISHTVHILSVMERLATASLSQDASKELLQLAIDRLAQTIQLLQSCQLLDIKSVLPEVKKQTEKLPSNRLLQIVVSHWTEQ